jgi:hypothetical protein
VTAPLISPECAARLLDRTIYEEVCLNVRTAGLRRIEQRLAKEMMAQGARGQAMVQPARALVAKALRRIADDLESGRIDEDEDDLEYATALYEKPSGVHAPKT